MREVQSANLLLDRRSLLPFTHEHALEGHVPVAKPRQRVDQHAMTFVRLQARDAHNPHPLTRRWTPRSRREALGIDPAPNDEGLRARGFAVIAREIVAIEGRDDRDEPRG